MLLCLDRRDGKTLWERVVLTAPLEKKHDLNSYASATPGTDGKHVWVVVLRAAEDRAGLLRLRRQGGLAQVARASSTPVHGFCRSPVLYKDIVILNGDQDADAYIVAYDKTTGEERWRTDRPNKTRSYCTPLIVERRRARRRWCSAAASRSRSYDPDTGKQIWVMDGPTEQFVASLVYTEDVLFVTGGFPELPRPRRRPRRRRQRDRRPTSSGATIKGVSYVPSPDRPRPASSSSSPTTASRPASRPRRAR